MPDPTPAYAVGDRVLVHVIYGTHPAVITKVCGYYDDVGDVAYLADVTFPDEVVRDGSIFEDEIVGLAEAE